MELGSVLAIIGAAIAVIVTGIGSSIGMSWVQQATAGVVAEEPEKYNKTMILQLIPSSNALYGFVVGFLVVAKVIFDKTPLTDTEGLLILCFCLPVAFVGFVSCLCQAKVCVAGVHMVAKREALSGRAITMAVFIELFALFALIVSILGVLQIPAV